MTRGTATKFQQRKRKLPTNPNVTKDIWGFGYRREYSNRLRAAGLKIAKGPYPLREFWVRKFQSDDKRFCGWSAPGSRALRSIALAFWAGSEFDVAVVRIDPTARGNTTLTRVFHSFDALTNTMLQLTHDFWWDDQYGYHYTRQDYDTVNLITNLLTCYNAVFIDDTTTRKSWVFFHNVLPVSVPDKIRIRQVDGNTAVFRRSEMQEFLLNAGFEKTPDSLTGSRRVIEPKVNRVVNRRFEPFQVNLESWRKCGGDIGRWINREKSKIHSFLKAQTEPQRRKWIAWKFLG